MLLDGEPFTPGMAYDLGLTPRSLRDAVRDHGLIRPFHGVYVDAAAELTLERRAAALGLVTPRGAVVADRSAAWLRCIDLTDFNEDSPRLLEMVVEAERAAIRRSGIKCRTAPLPDGDIDEIQGLLVTSPARTAVDLARFAREGWGLAAVDAFLRAGTSREAMELTVARYPGERGIAVARANVEWGDPGAESVMESWARWRTLIVGLPRPRTQILVVTDEGERWVDFGYDDYRTGAEYDGAPYHDYTAGGADVRRYNALARAGWEVAPFGSADVLGARPVAALVVAEMLMTRGWRPDERVERALGSLAYRLRWVS